MNGLQAFNLLYAATRNLPFGSTVEINPIDACDLAKLTPAMLISRGFAEKYAGEVSASLLRGEVSALGSCLGLRLSKRRWAPQLVA